MTTHASAAAPQGPGMLPLIEQLALGLGLVVLFGPAYVMLDQTVWNVVGQGHGPVMAALALWLAWQRKDTYLAAPAQPAVLAGCLTLGTGLLMYVLGRSQNFPILYVGSQIWVLGGLILLYKGWRGLKIMWFPLFFIIFITPVPGPLVDLVTGPMKAGVSWAAENIMYAMGYPIGRAGVTLTIGPYKLLVADACAGLNSIFALEAIGVFYMSVMNHKNVWRNILLAVLVLPTSFVSNVVRVITLVLVTYYFGDEAGQGFVHGFAGILLFVVATVAMIALDALMGVLFFRNDRPQEPQHG